MEFIIVLINIWNAVKLNLSDAKEKKIMRQISHISLPNLTELILIGNRI